MVGNTHLKDDFPFTDHEAPLFSIFGSVLNGVKVLKYPQDRQDDQLTSAC